MTLGKKLKNWLFQGTRFFQQEAGTVVILYALAIIPIFGFLGLAIDLGRNYYVHSVITGAADAAAIAGARAGGTPDNMTAQAIAMFNANIPPNFIATINGPSVQFSPNNKVITVTASGSIPTTFMALLGQNNITASAASQASISTQGAEVVLALDNTGSMSGSPMAAEIQAAKQLVNILYGGNGTSGGTDTVTGLYVAIVPYTTTVNINMPGLTPSAWLTSAGKIHIQNTNLYPNIAPSSTSVGGRWMGCIEARTPPLYTSGLDATDTPPTSNATRFTPYLYPSTMVHNYVFGTALDRGTTTTSTTALGTPPWGSKGKTPGDNDWTLNGSVPSGSNLYFGDNYKMNAGNSDGNYGVGPNLGCPIPMLPLTASQSTVVSTINNMKATFRGGTMINVGLASAWWMISPRWVGMWPNTLATQPVPYGSTLKVLVLMTDGQNQWYDWPVGVPGDPDTTHNYSTDADYTGYGRLAEGRAGTTNPNNTISVLNSSMLNMCSAIKNNGVVIYTILFDHNGSAGGAATQAAFKSCASDPSKYFFSHTTQDLIDAFSDIGQSISSLRLTWPGQP